jgi:hypothetical protein
MFQSMNKVLGISWACGSQRFKVSNFIFKDQIDESSWTTVTCEFAYNASPRGFGTTHFNA